MFLRYVLADLLRNLRRTLTTTIGVILGVGLFTSVLFFVDGLSASMTQRAIATLPVDMQQIVTDPVAGNLRMMLSISPEGPVTPGTRVEVGMEIANAATVPAHEVTIRSAPPAAMRFVEGSATVDGVPLEGKGNPFSQGTTGMGLNIGTLAPGESVRLSYAANASEETFASVQDFASTFSTREAFIPVPANSGGLTRLADLAAEIRAIDGVARAEPLMLADLPDGALSADGRRSGAVRIFGFGPGYFDIDKSIAGVKGGMEPGKALLSAEAAAHLQREPGDMVALDLPDGGRIELEVSGTLDLTRARALFASRRGADLEAFVYTPDAIVLDPDSFADNVLPAFAAAAATRGQRLMNPPVREVDIRVDRARLNADPEAALVETQAIAEDIRAIAARRDFLLDNVSNTLAVAAVDARIAKRMFVFLGLPGAVLAALLAAYAGLVLGGAQRRERATLRIRGASRGHLLRMLVIRVGLIAAAGALAGAALGYVTAVTIQGPAALARVSTPLLAASGILGGTLGLLATGVALYVTGRRTIDQEIAADRAEFRRRVPLWRRWWLDLALLALIAAVTVVALAVSAFDGVPGSVYVGRPVTLRLWLLVLPIGVWLAGTLLLGRVTAVALERRLRPTPKLPDHPLRLIVAMSLNRRAWQIAEAAMIVSLIVALGICLSAFTASYDQAKDADARYITGGDLLVAFAPERAGEARPADTVRFAALDGVAGAAAVVYGTHNAIVRSARTSELASLAAIQPEDFAATAPADDAAFPSGSARETLGALATELEAILLSVDMARFLKAKVGDPLFVLLGRGTSQQREVPVRLAGLFERLPGFPDGVQAVISFDTYGQFVTPIVPAFFLLRLDAPSPAARDAVVTALRSDENLGQLHIQTSANTQSRDQSSLADLNIQGLLTIDRVYATAMGAAAVTIFVFGLMMQRRREYVALRALGVGPGSIRAVIGAEVAVVLAVGTAASVPVGLAMSGYLVAVLRPLFVLAPGWNPSLSDAAATAGAVAAAAVVATFAASLLVYRLRPSELLRDE